MYNLFPFKGIEKVSFGMTRQNCRTVINSDFETFKRNDFAENSTDHFPGLNIFLQYDKNDICQAIEFASPNNLVYNGKNLFDLRFSELINFYSPVSKKHEIEGNISVTYYDLGFGASKTPGDDMIESVLIFSEKYW
jgi:hypothetical protein